MSSANLDGAIRDLIGIATNDEFGLPVPDDFPFARVLPDECRRCIKNTDGTHKPFCKIGTDASPTRTQTQALIDHNNETTLQMMELQSHSQRMHLGTNGMKDYPALFIGDQYMIKTFDYELVGASGGEVTLKMRAGDTDPRALPYSYPNPDYISGAETPDEPATLIAYKAMCGRAMIRFNSPSALRMWDGWVFDEVIVGSSFTGATGQTFKVHIEGGATLLMAATKFPTTDTTTITATILQYPVTNSEPWIHQRLIYPLYAKATEKALDSPTAALTTLESNRRIVYGTFSATDQDGAALSLSSLVVTTQNASGWSTSIDLTGYDLTGITAIICAYKIESADATGVVCAGQSKCKYCVYDPTGSWGDPDGSGGSFYCAKRVEVKESDTADSTSILGRFNTDCYQHGYCPHFAKDAPTNPLAAVEQLLYSFPYLARTPVGQPTMLSRQGVPGMMSLCSGLMGIPDGKHEGKVYTWATGGWAKASVYGDELFRDDGLHLQRQNDTRQVPYFLNTATWPNYGPGGDNITGRKNEYNGSPGFGEEAQVLSRDCDVNPYSLTVTGSPGKRQRFRTGATIYIPAIGTEDGVYRNGHLINRGFWDSDFQPCAEGSETYKVKITLAAGFWSKFGEQVTTCVVDSVFTSGGVLGFYLRHKSVQQTIDIPDTGGDPGDTIEVTKYWKQGATNVAVPEVFRPWNYTGNQTFHGPGVNYARAGHILETPDGHRVWISYAKACYDSSHVGSWDISKTTPGSDTEERDYYAGNVSLSEAAGIQLPLAHGPNLSGVGGTEMMFWANRLDYIGVNDTNNLLGSLAAGDTISIRNDGRLLEGATVKTCRQGSDAADTTATGAKCLGAGGLIFLPSVDDGRTCVIVEGTEADQIAMPIARELNAIKTTLGRMMRE